MIPNDENVFGNAAVAIRFLYGENPLSNYSSYLIEYEGTSIPTTDNINSILQWTNATFLSIQDTKDSVVTCSLLLKRIDEMSLRMTKLKKFRLSLQKNSV